MPPPSHEIRFSLAQPEHHREVMALLAAAAPEEGFDALWVASHEGRPCAATAARLDPGRIAVLTAPRLSPGEPQATAVALLEHVLADLATRHVCLAQVLIDFDARGDAETLRAAGFSHLADVIFLVAMPDEFPPCEPEGELEFEPYSPAHHARLARAVELTYEETRDSPALDGLRSIDDVLAGYWAAGTFDPGRWLLVRQGGGDIGCLLLTEHPAGGPGNFGPSWELQYMGLAPAARGRRRGAALVRYAQWLAGLAGATRLVLAVDADNQPALRTYLAAGFREWQRKAVYGSVVSGQPNVSSPRRLATDY